MDDPKAKGSDPPWSLKMALALLVVPGFFAMGATILLRTARSLWRGTLKVSPDIGFSVLMGTIFVYVAVVLMRKALRAREKGVPWMVILSLWTEVIFPKRKPITSTAGNAIAWILLVPVVLIALAGAMALFMQK